MPCGPASAVWPVPACGSGSRPSAPFPPAGQGCPGLRCCLKLSLLSLLTPGAGWLGSLRLGLLTPARPHPLPIVRRCEPGESLALQLHLGLWLPEKPTNIRVSGFPVLPSRRGPLALMASAPPRGNAVVGRMLSSCLLLFPPCPHPGPGRDSCVLCRVSMPFFCDICRPSLSYLLKKRAVSDSKVQGGHSALWPEHVGMWGSGATGQMAPPPW